MTTFHKPGSIQELKGKVPVCLLGLVIAFVLPIEWFPKFPGRYALFIAYCLIMVGMDAVSTSLQAAGLVKSVSSLPIRGFLSIHTLNTLAVLSLLCTLFPMVLLNSHERFSEISTIVVVVLLTLGIYNRIGARRILRDCEALQQEIGTGMDD